ncbi:MAG: linear amide C-N hydrolase [Lachnospiraceae bacterium]|nr:linear amide C-N hydrolase [Lachnospiraceae bacterium]
MKGTLKTLRSFRKMEDPLLYVLDYTADYDLERLLKLGAGTDEEFAKNVCRILLNGLPIAVKPEGACSTFTATTPEGEKLFSRNFDYRSGLPMLVRAVPKKGYKSLALSNLGHIGFNEEHLPEAGIAGRFKTLASVYSPLDGMNEKGFAVAVNTAVEQITHQKTGKTPVMTTCAIRLLLDNAADVEEGIRILRSVDMNSSGKIGYHFQLADRSGNSAVVEYLDNEMIVIRKQENEPYQCLTNFTISTAEKNGTGLERYEILDQGLSKSGAILSETEAMGLLDAAQMLGHKYYEPGHMYYNSRTQWSVVYNLSKGTALIAVKTDYEKTRRFEMV